MPRRPTRRWTTLPVVKVESDDGSDLTHVEVPFPVERKPFVPSRLHESARPMTVRIDDLVATQTTVTSSGLEKYERGGGEPLFIYLLEERLYIADGHHRATAASLRGEETIDALVVDAPRDSNPRPKTIKISSAAYSALETEVFELAAEPDAYGMDEDEARAYALLVAHIKDHRLIVPDGQSDCNVIYRTLTDLSNSFDDRVERGYSTDKAYDRRASLSIGALASNMLRECMKARNPAYRERLPGGLAAGRRPSDFDAKQLARGTKVELEHTVRSGRRPTRKETDLAREIAMDHLVEDPGYYIALAKMEKGLSRPREENPRQRRVAARIARGG